MKKLFTTVCVAATLGLLTSCGTQTAPERTYNEGINIIPMPASLQQQEGRFFFLCSYAGSQNYCRVLRSQIEKFYRI
jgi:hypothetical protein